MAFQLTPSLEGLATVRGLVDPASVVLGLAETKPRLPHGPSELKPLGLSERESADLVAFVAALEGEGPDAALLTAPR